MSDDPIAFLFSLQQFGVKLGLRNMRVLLDALGSPEASFRAVHVAGTNGKGSVTAMIEAAVRAAGYRTGRYTSPHLVRLGERFAIDGVPVGDDELFETVATVKHVIETLRADGTLEEHPTFFEATTATAFELFRRHRVEIAVCEVGLGGRLDATNVLSPVVSVITSIARDHEQHLGSTLGAIAAEKAGIIKTGVPVVLGPLANDAAVVVMEAARHAAFTVQAAEGASADSLGAGAGAGSRQRLRVKTPRYDYGVIELGLQGEHQSINALIAIRTLETLNSLGIEVPPAAIVEGLASVRWPGRLEELRMEDGRTLLLDAAHNPAGAETLARYLKTHGARPLVFSAMKDKDVEGILRALEGAVSSLVLTQASHPRAARCEELAEAAATALPGVGRSLVPDPEKALETAWGQSSHIAAAGSIFLLGDIMKGRGISW